MLNQLRLSTETDVIGTYSITQAGDNIGLLIGCFLKLIQILGYLDL